VERPLRFDLEAQATLKVNQPKSEILVHCPAIAYAPEVVPAGTGRFLTHRSLAAAAAVHVLGKFSPWRHMAAWLDHVLKSTLPVLLVVSCASSPALGQTGAPNLLPNPGNIGAGMPLNTM
jgi:hypothetical protein